jgi:hypothetical protein
MLPADFSLGSLVVMRRECGASSTPRPRHPHSLSGVLNQRLARMMTVMDAALHEQIAKILASMVVRFQHPS